MPFQLDQTIKVLFKSPDEDGDENDSSGNTFVTTCMLLVINMIANDLNLPVEYYLSKTVPSQYVDIYVNFNDEDKVYEESSVELIWPHYQNRYCIIYSNTIKNLPSEILREFSVQNMSSHISWFIGFILYLTVFRFNKYKHIYGRAFSYSVQSQMLSATPELKLNQRERFFIGAKLLHNILFGTLSMSCFATYFIAPGIRLIDDEDAFARSGRINEPISDFGIGEPCLFELKQGFYARRGCFMACDVANSTVQENRGIVFLKEEINFQNIFKISKTSGHLSAVKRLIQIYSEAGLLDHIFSDIHINSHKFLEEMRYDGNIGFNDFWAATYPSLITGYAIATISFVCEVIYFYWSRRKPIVRGKQKI